MSFLDFLFEDNKSVKAKWLKDAEDEGENVDRLSTEIDTYFQQFKKLKGNAGFIVDPENDIEHWKKGNFDKFKSFVDSKTKELEDRKSGRKKATSSDKIFDSEAVTVFSPNSPKASREFCGTDSKDENRPPWCIASTSQETAESHWERNRWWARLYWETRFNSLLCILQKG